MDALHLVELESLPVFCAGCRGGRGCGYNKDATSNDEFDLMHTHMCSLGLFCMRAVAGSGSIIGDDGARLRLRALENTALCLAVD